MENDGRTWLGAWLVPEDGDIVSNYYEDQKLMEGPLIKIGDYAHFRYFILYRNGRFCYYELHLPSKDSGDVQRIHLTLTPEHLRGVIMLNVSFLSKEEQCSSNLVEDGMTFYRKRLEMNLTGYSLHGQVVSWKLRASNELTFGKWERAFRLALRPIWILNTSNCLICKTAFSLLYRPHHCRKCGTCMCENCSVFIPRLPMLGYYNVVRICRDCRPDSPPSTSFVVGTKVLVYGIYPGQLIAIESNDDETERGQVTATVEMEWGIQSHIPCCFLELYSETVISANRIKRTIQRHLAQTLFRTQLNFNTWNILETMQEQKTVQMVRILKNSSSMTDLRSMIPQLGLTSQEETEQEEDDNGSYHGIRLSFPLRLENVLKLMDQFRNGIVLHRIDLYQLLQHTVTACETWHVSCMNHVTIPTGVILIVVGDLHGQLEDFLTILSTHGVPSPTTWYVFNGDFIDRGAHGIEVIVLILSFKLIYPDYVFLNRGNHEERFINQQFGFEEEIYMKYRLDGSRYSANALFDLFEQIFITLPLFTLVNERVFITHGGLSHHANVTLEELRRIKHQRDIPTLGTTREDELFTHLLWSDPQHQPGWIPSARGAGVMFGPDITSAFCTLNQLSLIIRSHECKEEGYELMHDGLLLTIFSASTYCASQTNKGAVVQLQMIEHGTLKPHVVQFYAQPLQKLKTGQKEWRKKAIRLERRTLLSLIELIGEKKQELAQAFEQIDQEKKGLVTKCEWKQVLTKVVGLEIRFLLYFSQLATSTDVDGRCMVDYHAFLDRYTVEIHYDDVEQRRHVLDLIWVGFCELLSTTQCVETMSMTEKLQAAFELFQTQQKTSQSTQSLRGIATQRSHENYRSNGLITYDIFCKTVQQTLGLDVSEQQVLELMQWMDTNQDGFIDFQEFGLAFRAESLQEFLKIEEIHAIDLLYQFSRQLASFPTLETAFKAIQAHDSNHITEDDLYHASQAFDMKPAFSHEDAVQLHRAILETYVFTGKETSYLDWNVFEDVFSLNNTRQRSLWLSNRSNLHVSLSDSSLQTRSNRADDGVLEHIKTSLHTQRLHLKFVFRMLDKKHCGFLDRDQFITAMQCVNQEHGCPLQPDDIAHVADAFTLKPQGLNGTIKEKIRYPAFLRSLRVVSLSSSSGIVPRTPPSSQIGTHPLYPV